MGCQACSGIEQRLRFPQIERIETFGEPAVDRSKQFARLLHLALVTPEAREARSDALGGQQSRGDGCPFRRKITRCRPAACLPIPIIGIVEIALNAVQVSVNPCAVRASPSATIWCALFQSSLPAHQSATNVSPTVKALTAHGFTLTCTALRAISTMPVIGIGRHVARQQPVI